MTDEQLRLRLELLDRQLEELHREVQLVEPAEGETPDFDAIGADALACAEAMQQIQASVACLFIDVPLRSLPIRGALRHLENGA